jgi:hypothetical protein
VTLLWFPTLVFLCFTVALINSHYHLLCPFSLLPSCHTTGLSICYTTPQT